MDTMKRVQQSTSCTNQFGQNLDLLSTSEILGRNWVIDLVVNLTPYLFE